MNQSRQGERSTEARRTAGMIEDKIETREDTERGARTDMTDTKQVHTGLLEILSMKRNGEEDQKETMKEEND